MIFKKLINLIFVVICLLGKLSTVIDAAGVDAEVFDINREVACIHQGEQLYHHTRNYDVSAVSEDTALQLQDMIGGQKSLSEHLFTFEGVHYRPAMVSKCVGSCFSESYAPEDCVGDPLLSPVEYEKFQCFSQEGTWSQVSKDLQSIADTWTVFRFQPTLYAGEPDNPNNTPAYVGVFFILTE